MGKLLVQLRGFLAAFPEGPGLDHLVLEQQLELQEKERHLLSLHRHCPVEVVGPVAAHAHSGRLADKESQAYEALVLQLPCRDSQQLALASSKSTLR
jgi:hypothetical protein